MLLNWKNWLVLALNMTCIWNVALLNNKKPSWTKKILKKDTILLNILKYKLNLALDRNQIIVDGMKDIQYFMFALKLQNHFSKFQCKIMLFNVLTPKKFAIETSHL